MPSLQTSEALVLSFHDCDEMLETDPLKGDPLSGPTLPRHSSLLLEACANIEAGAPGRGGLFTPPGAQETENHS